MSIESRCTIGAIASKKASAPSPVSRPIASASASGGERPGGDDDIVPVVGRQAGDLVALDGYERMAENGRFDAVREAVAVDRERAPGRHLMRVGVLEDD